MTRSDIVDSLADRFDMTKRHSGDVVDHILDIITYELRAGGTVRLSSFGSFRVRARAKRYGRNPLTGEKVEIPATVIPAFEPGKGLREAVAGSRAIKRSKLALPRSIADEHRRTGT